MAHGDSSQQIRQKAVVRFIEPARRQGAATFSIPIRTLMAELEAEGFPKNRPAQFCSAVQKEAFRAEQLFEIERVEGPPSGKSTTVVLHCRFKAGSSGSTNSAGEETPEQRAFRVTEELSGRLREVIKSFGGTKGYMAWVRREGE